MAERSDPIVSTTAGRVRGFWRGDSAAFLGIPFAQPPIGELRFAAPVPVPPWDGVRDAVEDGATAQRGDHGPTLIPEPSIAGDSTLNVNVFTPAPEGVALPVLVYIHGGGFTAGSPASPWYDGRAFNRDGVVTVTVSYRLGFDGFGEIEGAPSNRGVRDWLAALEWVRENIAAFGGDPARVTIAGQSAGGGAVLTLLGMPAAQGLFHAAWSISGAMADVSAERAAAISRRLAAAAGVEPTREGFASVSEERILELQDAATRPDSKDRMAPVYAILEDGLSLGPVVDGELIPRPTMESLSAGVGADKPLVIGATDDEFSMTLDAQKNILRWVPAGLALRTLRVPLDRRAAYLAANPGARGRGTAAVLGRFVTDTVFRTAVVRVARARERAAAGTWAYRFSWVSGSRGWALHCLDVPFFFDCLGADGVTAIAGDDPPQALADDVHGAAVAFVTGGDPGWLAWGDAPGTARVFDAEASTPAVDPAAYASVEPLLA